MKRALVLLGTVVLLLVAVATSSNAQETDDLELGIEEVDAADYPEVTIIVSVPPQMVGKNLTSDDFTVTESGEERPSTATPVPTDGLQVVLLLDTSGSMQGPPIFAARAAAQEFLDAMPDGVEVAVVSFANEPTLHTEFTTDKEQISDAIASLELGANTALYDGLVAGAELFEGQDGSRRTIVLLSDGGDTASVADIDAATGSLLGADVSFYAVELQSPEYDGEALAQLGAATRGIVVPAEDPEALSAVFVDVAGQIVNRYELQYESEAHGRTDVVVAAEADGVVASASGPVLFPSPPPPPTTPPTTSISAPVVDEVAAPPPIRTGAVTVLKWTESPTALWAGALAVFLALAALIVLTGIAQPHKIQPIREDVKRRIGESKGKLLSNLAGQATLLAERTARRGRRDSAPTTSLLETAGVHLRLGELIVLSIAAALVVVAVTSILVPFWLALLFGALTLLMVRVWLGRKATKRQAAFADQLVDVLQLISGSIRSGFGLMQAMSSVVHEVPAPAGEEFQRVKIETQLGRDTNEALGAMAARVGSEDFKWVVEAIEIHAEVGGDLSDILDSVMETVRDRIRVRRRIQTLSAEGRMSGLVLTLLPIALVLVMLVLNPDYLVPLLTTSIGRAMMAVGVVLMIVGAFWMRHVTSLKF